VGRTTLDARGRSYTVNFDDQPRPGDRYQSFVIAQLVDELTQQALTGNVAVTTDLNGARPRTARDAICGVAGIPSRTFPELDAQPYDFDLIFAVEGFVPLRRSQSFAQQPNFPDEFVDVDLGRLALRRLPVTVVVRAMTLDGQNRPVPLPGTTVEVTSIWRTIQDLSGGPTAPDVIALRPPLYGARPQPGTTLERVTMTPVAEPERRLERAAEPGVWTVDVGRTGGLGPGSVIGIDLDDDDRTEYIDVADVVGPADPDSPATLILSFPVRNRHREGTPAQGVTPAALGAPTAGLTVEGLPGDATVFVDNVAPFSTAPLVRISGGSSADEYVRAAPYRVTTDVQGYGLLPPLTRIAAVEIAASGPGPLAAPVARFTPQYGVAENHFHVVLE
jgi:hypothetical protein